MFSFYKGKNLRIYSEGIICELVKLAQVISNVLVVDKMPPFAPHEPDPMVLREVSIAVFITKTMITSSRVV